MPATTQLRRDALTIWQAGVDAVRPQRLVPAAMRVDGNRLWIGQNAFDLSGIGRILVVGAGKAGAAMAIAVEQALGPDVCHAKTLSGWVNVPADTLSPAPRWIHLHAARPAGMNEPTPEGVFGSGEILRLVAELQPDDLCLCLISGGGSALLPAPAEGVSLADKLALTQQLSAAGANIGQLNTVRKHLSRIKSGRLAAACRAGQLVSLIISDVMGDVLDLIASGPTVADDTTDADALEVLDAFGLRRGGLAPSAVAHLESCEAQAVAGRQLSSICQVTNLLIGNLALAVAAAAAEARRLGYQTSASTASQWEGVANDVGRQLAEAAIAMPDSSTAHCLVSGGEPTVVLADPAIRGRGGRNQQLALAAGELLLERRTDNCLVLSGGTDGEDGPTDAAGAWADLDLMTEAVGRQMDPASFLARNDAYRFFDAVGGLIRTGPTGTNVGDLRVVLAGAKDGPPLR